VNFINFVTLDAGSAERQGPTEGNNRRLRQGDIKGNKIITRRWTTIGKSQP